MPRKALSAPKPHTGLYCIILYHKTTYSLS